MLQRLGLLLAFVWSGELGMVRVAGYQARALDLIDFAALVARGTDVLHHDAIRGMGRDLWSPCMQPPWPTLLHALA